MALSASPPDNKLCAKMFVGDKHEDECKSGQMFLKFHTCVYFYLFPIFVQLSNLPKNCINQVNSCPVKNSVPNSPRQN